MTHTPANFVVWSEIPVSDLSRGIAFYEAATGGTLARQMMGPQEVAVFTAPGVSCNLVEGTPAGDGKGPTLHLVCAGTLEEAMDRVWSAGGKIVSPAVDIPEGRFAYALDPDGNSISVFEAA